MFKTIFFVAICLSIALLSGCNGHCLTVEGTYKDYGGGLTWCVDSKQSQEAGQPVVKNEAGESAILVSEKDVVVMAEILAKETQSANPSANISSVSNFAEFTKFMRIIKQKKQ